MKPFIRPTISILLIVLSVLGLLNVYSDNSDVEVLARKTACSDCPSEALRLAAISRTPITQEFHFEAAASSELVSSQSISGPWPKVIHCTRAAIFFGDYSCKLQ